jgi:ERCC4-related helicase
LAGLEIISFIGGDDNVGDTLLKQFLNILKKEHCVVDSERRRTLVFVRTRDTAYALKKVLADLTPFRHCNAAVFFGELVVLAFDKHNSCVGINTESSRQQQRQVLESFERGDHRVLLATTVAEEGLDISDCNLVITYNHTENEIARVQKKGESHSRFRSIRNACFRSRSC